MVQIAVQKELHGAYGSFTLDVECTINQGEFVALSGKSGSGKTTLLRIIAGLQNAHGSITAWQTPWQTDTYSLPPQQRKIGFVSQDYALFTNMNLLRNLLFVANDRALASHLLDIMELQNLAHKYPHQLSGGQQQRVALARALMRRPKLLLLDEPLSALDATMRLKLQKALLRLHKEFDLTTIMSSHDMADITTMASRLIVLDNGHIIQDGTPQQLLQPEQAQIITKNGNEILLRVGNKLVRLTL